MFVKLGVLILNIFIYIYIIYIFHIISLLLISKNPNFNLGFTPTFRSIILLSSSLLFYLMHKHIKLQHDAIFFIICLN
jgi:hypothetical protein